MPETRKYETNEMVDIDTSGPEVDVTLPEEKKENENEAIIKTNEDSNKSDVSSDLLLSSLKLMKTVISPMIHLRNLMSSWMFEWKRTRKNLKKFKKKKVLRINKN
jgi:hypothetical protein